MNSVSQKKSLEGPIIFFCKFIYMDVTNYKGWNSSYLQKKITFFNEKFDSWGLHLFLTLECMWVHKKGTTYTYATNIINHSCTYIYEVHLDLYINVTRLYRLSGWIVTQKFVVQSMTSYIIAKALHCSYDRASLLFKSMLVYLYQWVYMNVIFVYTYCHLYIYCQNCTCIPWF